MKFGVGSSVKVVSSAVDEFVGRTGRVVSIVNGRAAVQFDLTRGLWVFLPEELELAE